MGGLAAQIDRARLVSVLSPPTDAEASTALTCLGETLRSTWTWRTWRREPTFGAC